MKLFVFAVRDIQANAFMTPFFGHNVGAAVREFGDICRGVSEPTHPLAKHPEDYELYKLGDWTDGDAKFVLHDPPQQLAAGSNYKK